MVGAGYVGLVSGACFSEFGADVVCVANDAAKIERLARCEIPMYEPGLEGLVRADVDSGRLTLTGGVRSCGAAAAAGFTVVAPPPAPCSRPLIFSQTSGARLPELTCRAHYPANSRNSSGNFPVAHVSRLQ